MTDEQREESGAFYREASRWLDRLESGRSFSYFDPMVCWAMVVIMTKKGIMWERGLLW